MKLALLRSGPGRPSLLRPLYCWLSLLLFMLLLPGLAGAQARTLHVSPLGSDSGDGSAAAPFRQIRRALASAQAGDLILAADGDYLGFDVAGIEGLPGQPVVIRAPGGSARIHPTTDRSDNRDTIHVAYSAHVTFEGLRVFNANRAGLRINTSRFITVRGCVFGNNRTWGIFSNHSDDLLVEGNECFNSQVEHGIYLSNSGDRPTVRRNRVYGNRLSGIQLNADVNAGGDGIITGAVVDSNVVFDNGRYGGAALNLDGVQDSLIVNNLLFSNYATGIACYQIGGAEGPRGLRLLHNTIDMPAEGRWALQLTSSSGGNLLRNNILLHRSGFRGGLEYGSQNDVLNTDSRANLLDRIAPGGGPVATLTEWQALGHEEESQPIGVSRLFENPPAGDYRLAASSPGIDRGETRSDARFDLAGRQRPAGSASDIGCYEAPDTIPPAAPAGLVIEPGDRELTLRWNGNGEADLAGYQVYRSEAAAGPYAPQLPAPLAGTNLRQTDLQNHRAYWYSITAVDSSGNESAASPAIAGTPRPRTFTLEGTVRLGSSPLPGVTVQTDRGQKATTGADGRFTLAGLEQGSYRLTPELDDHVFAPPSLAVTAGEQQAPVEFLATPAATLVVLNVRTHQIRGGRRVTGRVTFSRRLTRAAEISLTSSNPDAVIVPARVMVKRGRFAQTFRIRTRRVTQTTPVTLTAVHHTTTRTTVLTVQP